MSAASPEASADPRSLLEEAMFGEYVMRRVATAIAVSLCLGIVWSVIHGMAHKAYVVHGPSYYYVDRQRCALVDEGRDYQTLRCARSERVR